MRSLKDLKEQPEEKQEHLVKLREVNVSMKGEWSTLVQAPERAKNLNSLRYPLDLQ